MHKITTKFSRIAKEHAGRILLHSYADNTKCFAFSPLVTPVQSTMKCECGHAVWNATNFGNLVHFCPDREMTVEVTDFVAIQK